MFSFKPFKAIAAGFAVLVSGWASGAYAQSATCGINGSATATAATYDPFNPSGLAATTVTLNLTRINPGGGGKTAEVNFYLKSNSAATNGTIITPISGSGDANFSGYGLNIFYDFLATGPTLQPTSTTVPSAANRFFKIEFTGNNVASDTVSVTFTVQLPANLDLNASTVLPFDAYYSCRTTGGGGPTDQPGFLGNAVSFPITVLSALQASFVGTALDFGEIGDETGPGKTTAALGPNYIRVQSSGAYEVKLQSQNAFRLFHPGGGITAAERVNYKLKFLGVEKSNATTPGLNAVALTQNCDRAGVGGLPAEDRLPLLATLEEGGQGKTPGLSGNYSDTLTVTITPQAIGVSYPTDCGSFTVP